ncbi:unnamed protein product [Alopecurus aequalis]
MDILVSAIIGDLASRSASFVIGKYFRRQPGVNEILQRLQRVVPRIDTVVEEAEGRDITNQGMLRQLKMLRQEMYKGHYVLDALKSQAALDEEEVSHSSTAAVLSESSASPAKRLRFSGGGGGGGGGRGNRGAAAMLMFGANKTIREELQRVVEALEDTMDAGMREFVSFLALYPRVLRQPYCAYLLLENCMFGRQTEREQVLNFLLCPSTSATPSLPVLPIVGPLRVGKSTLVEHVCRDESVRDHFSRILFFSEGSLEDEGVIIDPRGSNCFQVRHQKCVSRCHERLLLVVEVAENINDGTWTRLKSSVSRMAACGGSKIIVTSRSDMIVDLGTTEAVRLHGLPPDAHWYFFKSLAFGSAHPDENPGMVRMAMEIASDQRRCLMRAQVVAGLLRDNFDARLWRAVLECVRAYRKMHPSLCSREDEPPAPYHWRLGRSCKNFFIYKHHQSGSSEEVPKISVQDIVLGRGGRLPRGEFQALALRSSIPPYYNYMVTCTVPEPQPTVGRKKPAILNK